MTGPERLLWQYLRDHQLGVKFRRQYPIDMYIVDFISFDIRLIIEVDGDQHFENKRDVVRDRYLRAQGFHVMRFWNNEVFEELGGVLEVIRAKVARLLSPHQPPPGGGGFGARGVANGAIEGR